MGAQESKKLWDKYFADALEDTKKTSRIVLEQTWHGTLDGKDATDEMIMRRQLQYSARNKKLLRLLWAMYDQDKSDRLDMKELVVLCTDMLNALFDWLPKMMRALSKDTFNFMKDKFSKDQLKEIKAILNHNIPLMARKCRRWVKQQLQDVDSIADKIYEKIDDDGSGYIKMSEFIANFGWAAMEIINPMAMLAEVERNLYLNPDMENDEDEHLDDEGLNIFGRLRNKHRRRKHKKRREKRRRRKREQDDKSSDAGSSSTGTAATSETSGSSSNQPSSKWKFFRKLLSPFSRKNRHGTSDSSFTETATTMSDDTSERKKAGKGDSKESKSDEKSKDKDKEKRLQRKKAPAGGSDGTSDREDEKSAASGGIQLDDLDDRKEEDHKDVLQSLDMDALKAEWSEPAPRRSTTMKHA